MHYKETGWHTRDRQPLRDNCLQGRPHSDTARQLVVQSHSHTHFRTGCAYKVTQHQCPYYLAIQYITVIISSPSIPYPAVLYHSITEKHSLSSFKHTRHTDTWPHTIRAPCSQTHISHIETHNQHTIYTHSQVHAHKCSDPDTAFTVAFMQKTQFLTVILSPNHTQKQTVQHTHRHTHQILTQTQVLIVTQGHKHAGHTNIEAPVTYTPSNTHSSLVPSHTQTHLYLESDTVKYPLLMVSQSFRPHVRYITQITHLQL